MTARYTEEEWLDIIKSAEKNLIESKSVYKAPGLGSEAFAKSIDHTLLKLNATKEQVTELCEEAKRYNFKVQFGIAAGFFHQQFCSRDSARPLPSASRLSTICYLRRLSKTLILIAAQ